MTGWRSPLPQNGVIDPKERDTDDTNDTEVDTNHDKGTTQTTQGTTQATQGTTQTTTIKLTKEYNIVRRVGTGRNGHWELMIEENIWQK